MKRLLFSCLLSPLAAAVFSVADDSNSGGVQIDVTYHRDIAPIIYGNCTSCHREGESAPFPLSSFTEVSRKASTIRRVVADRYMPPWHANPETTEFLDVRQLRPEQITLINQWVEAGKPEGDPGEAPPMPDFPEGWQLGEPDLVLTMADAYEVPSEGPDIYRNFVLPLDLDGDKWVKAVELRPSARSVVHHSLFFLDNTGSARKLDGKDGKPGFNGMSFRRSGSLGAYVPGSTPRKLPGDLARPLPKGSDLILSTHFHPSGKVENEQTTVGIYFADGPPSRPLQEVQVPPNFGRGAGIDIAAGADDFVIEDTFVIPHDVEAISISGHAHYLCTTMRMTATLPDGTERILLDIPEWDLNWQDSYYFARPIILPEGTVLKSVIVYDNSANNPNNPFHPPQRVKWGRESTDEMGSITLTGVPLDPDGDKKPATTRSAAREKLFARLGEELRGARLLERLDRVVETLDKNTDGLLQESELPERTRAALLLRFDQNGDRALDAKEIENLRDWLASLQTASPEA